MLEYRCTNVEKIKYGYLIEGDFFFILAQKLAILAIEETQTLLRNDWRLATSICFVKTSFFFFATIHLFPKRAGQEHPHMTSDLRIGSGVRNILKTADEKD